MLLVYTMNNLVYIYIIYIIQYIKKAISSSCEAGKTHHKASNPMSSIVFFSLSGKVLNFLNFDLLIGESLCLNRDKTTEAQGLNLFRNLKH